MPHDPPTGKKSLTDLLISLGICGQTSFIYKRMSLKIKEQGMNQSILILFEKLHVFGPLQK
jgi:hypothetical protein